MVKKWPLILLVLLLASCTLHPMTHGKAPAKFVISNLVITPSIAEAGQTVTISVDVSNIGETEERYHAVLTVNGTHMESRDVSVVPKTTTKATFSHVEKKGGSYQIAVGELAETLVVNESTYLEKIGRIPDYTQTDPAFGGFPGGGIEYCGPVSASNCIMWLSENGFPNLTPHSNDRKKDQFDVAYLLGSAQYMGTTIAGTGRGTNPTKFCRGLKQYVLDKGYRYKRLEFQGWRDITAEFDTRVSIPDFEWIKQGIKGNGCVWLSIGWYTYDSTTDEYERFGSHWVTLVGYGHDGKAINPNCFIINNPSTTSTNASEREYVLPERIDTGTLNGPYKGLPRSAAGYYKANGVGLPRKAVVAMIEYAVVLEMEP